MADCAHVLEDLGSQKFVLNGEAWLVTEQAQVCKSCGAVLTRTWELPVKGAFRAMATQRRLK